jgi:CRISP-associated protein Cas1
MAGHQLLNTLYITTPDAYIHLEQNNVRVDVDREKKLMIPLHHLGSIVCVGPVMISTSLMHRCAEDAVALVLLDWNGRFKARLEGPQGGNILLRQAQFVLATQPDIVLNLARCMVAGKLHNSRYVLLRGARDTDDETDRQALRTVADSLANHLQRLPLVDTMDMLRGIEGDAAKQYFGVFSYLLRPDQRPAFQMKGRSRRPPLDRINALLSFAYALIRNDCRTALETVGLDPQQGFLHTVRPGRASLALDLMEEFRPILADRLVLTLLNRMQLTEKDITEEPGGVFKLSDAGRKTLLIAYQDRKKDEVSHAMVAQRFPLGLVPQLQARLLARVIRGELPFYQPYRMR